MHKPNFLIVGTAKSGTTSLHKYLEQHPQIFMSSHKEPFYFALKDVKPDFRGPGDQIPINDSAVTSLDQYLALFDECSGEVAIGESSTCYLYIQRSVNEIKKLIPDAKIIIMLRNPADRAYSSFMHLRMQGRETLESFDDSLLEEKNRIQSNYSWIWHYKSMGFYYPQVKRYIDAFGRKNVKIYLYEDFRVDQEKTVKDIFDFLGVDSSFSPDLNMHYNKTGFTKSEELKKIFNQTNLAKKILKKVLPYETRRAIRNKFKNWNMYKPKAPLNTIKMLLQEYEDDILKLQTLIERDLSIWFKYFE